MALKKPTQDFTVKAASLMAKIMGGGREAWNGQVSVFNDQPEIAAQMSWAGALQVSDEVARGIKDAADHPHRRIKDPDAFEVLLHEMVHGLIGGSTDKINAKRRSFGIKTPYREEYSDHERAYQDPATGHIEEGFTELGTIHHAPEFFRAMGLSDRKTSFLATNIPLNPFGSNWRTMNDLALDAQDPVKIENGEAWGHYNWQTRMAQDWVQQVAQDEGHGDLRIGTPGYDRTRELSDEINREGASRKVNVMADQVIRAALKDSPEAPLLEDEIAMSRVQVETRRAILEAWSGQEAAMDAHRAAISVARNTAHTVAMDRRAA